MTDKELLKQLNSLKSIRMESDAKESNKKVLMTQISNTISDNVEVKSFNSFSFYFKNILSMSSRPAMVFSGVFLFVLSSLILGSDLYKNSKPNDSLYIARVISERARINTTFSQVEREKLALEFASNHAKDIATLLMDPEFNVEENKDQVEKLSASFRNEIGKVKTKVNDLKTEDFSPVEEVSVFSASSLKEENGMEIYKEEGRENLDTEEKIESMESENNLVDLEISGEESVASTSEELEKLEATIEELSEGINASDQQKSEIENKKILIQEIEKLFEEGRYGEVVLKIQEIK